MSALATFIWFHQIQSAPELCFEIFLKPKIKGHSFLYLVIFCKDSKLDIVASSMGNKQIRNGLDCDDSHK